MLMLIRFLDFRWGNSFKFKKNIKELLCKINQKTEVSATWTNRKESSKVLWLKTGHYTYG